MNKYYQITSDNYCDYGVTESPKVPIGTGFKTGSPVDANKLPPLTFSINFPAGERMLHLLGNTIPLFSQRLLSILDSLGIGNYQHFPAVLNNTVQNIQIYNYQAVNILGLVSADLNLSGYDMIMGGSEENKIPPLVAFNRIVLRGDKIPNLDLFRLAEQRSILVASERIYNALIRNRPGDGWGIDAIELEVV